jgi:GAF domain-containing protein/HAMP domain-containing protein
MSLRNRLLWAFIALAILPVLVTGTIATLVSAQGLRSDVYDELQSVTILKENAIKDWLNVVQTNLGIIYEDRTAQQGISALLQGTPEAVLDQNQLRNELISFNKRTGYFVEIFAIDTDGKIVLSTDALQEGKIQATQSFFQEGLEAQHVAPPAYDVSLSSYSIVISEPIKSANGTVIGVLAGRVNLSTLSSIMQQQTGLGEAGETYLVSSNYAVLADIKNIEFTPGETYIRTEGVTNAIRNKTDGTAAYTDYAGNETFGVYRWIPELQIALISEHIQTDALQASNRVLQITVGLMVITALIAVFIAFVVTRGITSPITKLVDVANNIAQGNLGLQAEVLRHDEIGVLAQSFNTMTARLQDLVGSLEQRVAERTQALSAVAEVSTVASTILDTNLLLQQVVDLSKERFNFYHAHIYLLDEAGNNLVLASGAGEPGRKMVAEGRKISLDREQSLVARAARERKGVTVNDVTVEPDFLPNPLLPETHSELAVPMMVGDEVIGVFDVQSEVVGRFTDSDIAVQTTLAAQVASAIKNARSYTEIQSSQALLSEALSISRLANWEYDVDQDLFTFNDNFYSIFRTSVEKAGGYKISSADYARIFVHPDDATLVGAEIQRVLESKERHFKTDLEHRIIYEGGEVGYISVKINVERDGSGKILRWYGANQDVTERRRLEELNRKRAQQQEALNLITQRIQSATTIEAALQVTARELGHALGMKQTLVTLEPEHMNGEREIDS